MNALEKFQLKQALTHELVKSASASSWFGAANQRMADADDLAAANYRKRGVLGGLKKSMLDDSLELHRSGTPFLMTSTAKQDAVAKKLRDMKDRESARPGKGGAFARYLAAGSELRAEKRRLLGQRQRGKGLLTAAARGAGDTGAVIKGALKGERPAHTLTTGAKERARDWWKKRREAEK